MDLMVELRDESRPIRMKGPALILYEGEIDP
jgi:hypothetical protein